jgi:hypothetical protein
MSEVNTEPVGCVGCGLPLAVGEAYGFELVPGGSICWLCAGCFDDDKWIDDDAAGEE